MSAEPAQYLNERQKRFALSNCGKRSVPGKVSRIVLAKPYSDYWPVVEADAAKELESIIHAMFPALKKPVREEDFELLRKVRGSKYKEKRRELHENIWERSPNAKELRGYFAFGINEVSCALEKHDLAALLIASEADPPILTRHLGTLAASRRIPFVVLPGLKMLTKNTLGFSCLSVGLKNAIKNDNSHLFSDLFVKISNASRAAAEKLQPKAIMNEERIKRPLELLTATEFPIPKSTRVVSNIYLYRDSKHHRVFVPGQGIIKEHDQKQPEYLSLSIGDSKNIQVPIKHPQIPLGSEYIPSTSSFLHRVRKMKANAQISSNASSFVSLKNADVAKEAQPTTKDGLKRTARYFDTALSSLKVKKIQSNPLKIKRKGNKNKNKSV